MDEENLTSINPVDEEFRKIFTTYLPAELKSRDKIQVLSIGCGYATEASGLLQALPQASYRGIDTDNLQIQVASDLHIGLSSERFQVDVADASHAENLGDDIDLVLLRNPAYTANRSTNQLQTTWSDIFKNCIGALKIGGHMFITATDKAELDQTMDNIGNDSRVEITSNVVRNAIRQDPKEMPFRDDYIAVARRVR